MNEKMHSKDATDTQTLRPPDESGETPETHPLASFRDIAVVLAQLAGDTQAITLAGNLARRAGARLHVLQMLAMPVEATDTWALIPDPSLVERYADIRANATRQASDIQHRLAAMCVQGEVRALEALYSPPSKLAAAVARRADLAVLGRPDGSPAEVSMAHAYFAGLLLESGRPVLVVPEGTRVHLPPRHALVAWADTAEAARAVHDALPFLEASEAVDVIVVDAPKGAPATERSVEGLLAHLRSHGVRAGLTICPSGRSPVSRVLLDQAHRKQAQLIVAGGYGHGRLREWALGGTTRELFLNSSIPVLFSH